MTRGRFVQRWHERLVDRMSLISAAVTVVVLGIALTVVVVMVVRPVSSQASSAYPVIDGSLFDVPSVDVGAPRDELAHPTLPSPRPPKAKHRTKPVKRDTAETTTIYGPPGETGPLGIPVLVLEAYQNAERVLVANEPGCHMRWWILAGIGHTESGHAAGGRVDASGTTRGRILGPRLDGHLEGNTIIKDTDKGVLDGDTEYDRAVGPMQFIPSTWASWGVDANGDGKADPNNVFDAAATAAYYLCNGGRDMAKPDQLKAAIFSYNNSEPYFLTVTEWAKAYHDRAVAVSNSNLSIAPDAEASPTATATPSRKPRASATTTAARPRATASATSPSSAAGTTSATPTGSTSPSPSDTASGGGLGGLVSNLGGNNGPTPSASTSP
jgi:hypothetical protein